MTSQIQSHVRNVRAALSLDDFNGFLKIVLYEALELTGGLEGGVLVADEKCRFLRIQQWVGLGVNDKSRIIPIDPTTSVVGSAVLLGDVIVVCDTNADSRFLARSESDIRSMVAIPVSCCSSLLGVVNIESSIEGFFLGEKVQLAKEFCEEIGEYWRLASLREWQKREAALQNALSEIIRVLPNGVSAVLDSILESALNLTESGMGGVLLQTLEGNGLRIECAKGIKQYPPSRIIAKGTGLVWKCFEVGGAHVYADVKNQQDYIDLSTKTIKSSLTATLEWSGNKLGVIHIENEELNHFGIEHIGILTLFARHAALAVIEAKRMQKLDGAKSIAALGNMSGNLRHRMNNIVGYIRVESSLLGNELIGVRDDLLDQLKMIETAATNALVVVKEYEELFGARNNDIDLVELIKDAIDKVRIPAEIAVTFDASLEDVRITSFRQLFLDLIVELLNNSIKSIKTMNSMHGKILVSISSSDKIIKIIVEDNGAGMPAGRLDRIFYNEVSSEDTIRNRGFGLWWGKSFITMLGGEIYARNNNSQGARLIVLIPKN